MNEQRANGAGLLEVLTALAYGLAFTVGGAFVLLFVAWLLGFAFGVPLG